MIGPTDLLHPSPAPHFKTFEWIYWQTNSRKYPHFQWNAVTVLRSWPIICWFTKENSHVVFRETERADFNQGI